MWLLCTSMSGYFGWGWNCAIVVMIKNCRLCTPVKPTSVRWLAEMSMDIDADYFSHILIAIRRVCPRLSTLRLVLYSTPRPTAMIEIFPHQTVLFLPAIPLLFEYLDCTQEIRWRLAIAIHRLQRFKSLRHDSGKQIKVIIQKAYIFSRSNRQM